MFNKKHSLKSMIILGVILLLLITLASIVSYRFYIEKNLAASSSNTMDSVLAQQKYEFASKLENQRQNIKAFANIFSHNDLTQEELIKELTAVSTNSTFSYATLVSLDGSAIENTGETMDLSDRDYFKRALKGETVIADPMTSKTTGESIVVFATPVRDGDEIVAVLLGVYDAETLSSLLQPSFGGKGFAYITTSDGTVMAKTQGNDTIPLYGNLYEKLEVAKTLKYDSVAEIKANVIARKSGHTQYKSGGEKRLLHYAPLGINEWTIFSIASESVVTSQSANILGSTTFFAIGIFALCLMAILYFFLQQKKHLKQLTEIAFVDGLTGAANRKKFKLAAADLLKASKTHYAFAIMDIDKFKVLNDTLGYACGDKLLIYIADVLRANIRNNETFGRCDSDEFYMLLQYSDEADIQTRIERIFSQVDVRFKSGMDSAYNLVLCVGIYVIADSTEEVNVITDRAKHAQLLAKGHLISSISFYSEKIHEKILQEKIIENRMHDALSKGEFMLYLQPKYQLSDETICGAEALVRWNTGGSLILYPDQFIPVFEKNGFVTKLDMYMLEMSCAFIKKWLDAGVAPIPISINFSRLHLQNENFVEDISAIVDKYQIPPNLIEVELTESTMLNNERDLINVLSQLHEHGFTLSMDDFGSGYSSLGLLKNLPVDTVKLDRTFFTQYNDLARAKTVISNMILMAKELGIFTVAEGVETKEHIDLLYGLGCDIVQGYYFAKPMPAVDLNALMKEELEKK